MKKLKKMPRLEGNIPFFYSQETIYEICISINALSGAVEYLAEQVEKLEKQIERQTERCAWNEQLD